MAKKRKIDIKLLKEKLEWAKEETLKGSNIIKVYNTKIDNIKNTLLRLEGVIAFINEILGDNK